MPVAAHSGSLEEELEEIRAATAKYTNPEIAYEDDWAALDNSTDPPTEIALDDVVATAEFVCGQGFHLFNLELVGTADPTTSPVLAYGVHDGTLVLGALDYVVPREGEFATSPPNFFEYDDGAEQWHPVELPFGEVWALHAWVHYPNPDGVFVDGNPQKPFHNHPDCEM
ncbi:hypothetical protein [Halorussus salinisoli]|uniref:hypothetical protein n=1 Tax=Halorussus salinisoli TaxID=2558242 RepID=UPI0010C20742|nr:hypothetical protein [Halorussus salinisoli]